VARSVDDVSLVLLPAVDVADGQSIRLVQGTVDTETGSIAAVDAVRTWERGGAEWIHLVDLDRAYSRGSNADLLQSVVAEVDVRVELSGGIGDDASLAWALATGCERVVISTSALADRSWCEQALDTHGDRIAFGLDVQTAESAAAPGEYRLRARGASAGGVDSDLWETIAWLDERGCRRYVINDASRDGMLKGPNLALYEAVNQVTTTPVIASGGVGSIADLELLAEAALLGPLEGCVVGKALYTGAFTLTEALNAVR